MLHFIGFTFIFISYYLVQYIEYKSNLLTNLIINEKIYLYPDDLNKLEKKYLSLEYNDYSSTKIIIKIPHKIIKNNSIGEIKLYNITIKDFSSISTNKKILTNNELFQKFIFFPTFIFQEFEFEQRLFTMGKIKILFNNTKIIDKNKLSTFSFLNNFIMEKNMGENIVIEENFITPFSDVYLLVNPYIKYAKQLAKIKFNIIVFGDNEKYIVNEKYIFQKKEWNKYSSLSVGSYMFGIVLLLLHKIIKKN